MTTPEFPRNLSAGDDIANSDGVRSRSMLAVVYTATTLLGGIGALVVLVVTATAPDASALDVLLWGALAVLLFAAAAREWWFKGIEINRSRRAAQRVSSSEIAATARESSSEVETVRKLRRAHPDLRLVDAVNLVRDGRPSDS
ncbi:hypothetical protein [Dietzia alimentaria]|uniref:hypothetical protein n=1 Tax=Dietzia alimentaria TaxID=665550 RepID=UPI00029A9F77|nr:hypothetical protein [Dietzia alimentaria]